MASFRCYNNSDVIATLITTNFHLYLIHLWWQLFQMFVCGDVVYAQTWQVLTLKNCMEPFSYASTAYLVASALVSVRLFCKWFTAPLAKNSPYAYVSWYVSCERNIHSSASKRPISEAQFKNCWIVTARSRSLTESLKIPLVRQNWGRPYTACKEYYNVYVAWIHVHIKSQISISNLYFNTVKIHQVFCYI